ncbi:metallophosphoesterase [Muricoccus aerilatus]|uniref:metallophosphoesterase n=1 Tax=Muricoccus aerilatus TaxID=452982 RepID=UPI0005C1BCC7|nr:metallophosphoesterase [Roseomonas aerilata]
MRELRDRFEGIRVVGDVHGEAAAFHAAADGAQAERLFLIQLGDLTDGGPDAPGVLRRAFALRAEGRGLFVLGNHDHKLRRALEGATIRIEANGLGRTLEQIDAAEDAEALRRRAVLEIGRAPAWLRIDQRLFVHGGFHPRMLHAVSPPDAGARKPEGLVPRAIFGQVTSRMREDGYPERLHDWVDRIPQGFTIYCGHEVRSANGRPLMQVGAGGGAAVFMDTGAGKGGHLSWVDLPW